MHPSTDYQIPGFVKKYGAWILLGLALLMALVRFIPAFSLATLNADNLVTLVLFRDLVEHGNAPQTFMWGGHSDFFPDILTAFGLKLIIPDGLLVLAVFSGMLFTGFIASLLLIYKVNGGKYLVSFGAILFLFFTGLATNFGFPHGIGFADFFYPNTHGGSKLMSLVCLALLQAARLKRNLFRMILLGSLCALSTFSDASFLATFTIPAVLSLLICRFYLHLQIKADLGQVAIILVPSWLGHVLAPALFPATLITDSYLQLSWSKLSVCVLEILREGITPAGGYLLLLIALDLMTLLFVGALLIRRGSQRMNPDRLFLLLFCGILIAANWSAAILTGNYVDVGGTRCVGLALLAPVLLILGWSHEAVAWNRTKDMLASLGAFLVSGYVSLFPPRPSAYYQQTMAAIPTLRSIMREENVAAGLSDYWLANPFTYFSAEKVPMRAITDDGGLYHWLNNLAWYARDNITRQPVKFGMILMARLNPKLIEQRFGTPDKVIHNSLPSELWIYSGKHAIVYNEMAGGLTNDEHYATPNEYHTEASHLPSATGLIEGESLVAKAGRDKDGCLSYGPYLHCRKGHYRVQLTYAYLAPPDLDKPVGYDSVLWNESKERVLDRADLPFVDLKPKIFTHDLELLNEQPEALEVRTFYRGSGSIRIDSLSIRYLGT